MLVWILFRSDGVATPTNGTLIGWTITLYAVHVRIRRVHNWINLAVARLSLGLSIFHHGLPVTFFLDLTSQIPVHRLEKLVLRLLGGIPLLFFDHRSKFFYEFFQLLLVCDVKVYRIIWNTILGYRKRANSTHNTLFEACKILMHDSILLKLEILDLIRLP